MKKFLCILLSAILILCSYSVAALAVNEKETVGIYYENGTSETVVNAASALEKYINLLPGNSAEINGKKAENIRITVSGKPAENEKPDGSYTIKTNGNSADIEITGYGHNGPMYAAYTFLREYGGYHDYAVCDGMKTDFVKLNCPENINIEYIPAFEYTDTDWPAPSDAEFAAANRVNGRLFRSYREEAGGSAGYISDFCHTLTRQFCSSEKYFDSDPELFALHSGRRTPNQLCLTNEKTYETVLGEVMDLLKEKHDPDASLQIISLTQHDNEEYCECAECAKLDEENGSHAGSIVTFVNRIANAVKDAGYDSIIIQKNTAKVK